MFNYTQIDLDSFLHASYINKLSLTKSTAVLCLAEDFGVTYSTVYRWLKDGEYIVTTLTVEGEQDPLRIDIAKPVAVKK